ncbi:MAG: hypothetical protein AAF368_15765, partial [Planctomycetota bacterium]
VANVAAQWCTSTRKTGICGGVRQRFRGPAKRRDPQDPLGSTTLQRAKIDAQAHGAETRDVTGF